MPDHQGHKPEDNTTEAHGNEAPDASGGALPIAVGPSQPPPTPESGTNPSTKQYSWRDNVTLLFEFLGLVALVVYTIFSILQWAQIRYTNTLTARALAGSDKSLAKTLEKMQAQIDAAKTANDLSRQSIVASQSATVVVESPRPISFPENETVLHLQGLYIYLANEGHETATRIHVSARMTREKIPGYRYIASPQLRSINADRMEPFDRQPIGLPGFDTNDVHLRFSTEAFTPDDVHRVALMHEAVRVSGELTYDNGFGTLVVHPFCFLYTRIPPRDSNGAPLPPANDGTWSTCADMEEHISQSLKIPTQDK